MGKISNLKHKLFGGSGQSAPNRGWIEPNNSAPILSRTPTPEPWEPRPVDLNSFVKTINTILPKYGRTETHRKEIDNMAGTYYWVIWKYPSVGKEDPACWYHEDNLVVVSPAEYSAVIPEGEPGFEGAKPAYEG